MAATPRLHRSPTALLQRPVLMRRAPLRLLMSSCWARRVGIDWGHAGCWLSVPPFMTDQPDKPTPFLLTATGIRVQLRT
jgi:hypothetical protein